MKRAFVRTGCDNERGSRWSYIELGDSARLECSDSAGGRVGSVTLVWRRWTLCEIFIMVTVAGGVVIVLCPLLKWERLGQDGRKTDAPEVVEKATPVAA